MGIPLRAGRDISPSDTATSEPVIVINETMARALWPGQDPIGKYRPQRLRARSGASSASSATCGISRSSRHRATRCTSRCASAAISRRPTSWCARRCRRRSWPPRFARALQPLAPNLPGNDFRTLQQLVDKSVSPRRFLVLLLGGFAAFALVLASLGIYGADLVLGEPADAGDRHPHGARRVGARRAGAASSGRRCGSPRSAWRSAPRRRGRWRERSAACCSASPPRDPGTFVGMLVVLTVVAAVAGYLPARRASRIDPMVALRAE